MERDDFRKKKRQGTCQVQTMPLWYILLKKHSKSGHGSDQAVKQVNFIMAIRVTISNWLTV